MPRALPVLLHALAAAGIAGGALLPAVTHLGTPQVLAENLGPIQPIAALDLQPTDVEVAAQLRDRPAALARARAAARAARAAAARRAEAAQRASRSRPAYVPPNYGSPRDIARGMLADRGWSGQFGCLDSLWSRESGWNIYAANGSSGAYGIPQALPGGKMASAGWDWRTNPVTQIRWGLGYIANSYGSPCGAWRHSLSYGWY